MKNNKTSKERFDEKFLVNINPVLVDLDATPEQLKQFFTSELEDIIKEIEKEYFYEMNNVVNKDYARGNDDALKKAIQIIKNRI